MMELWPFTNFHDLNLDWLISKWKKLEDNLDDIHASMDAAAASAAEAAEHEEQADNSRVLASHYAFQASDSADAAAASAESISDIAGQVAVNTSNISSLVANAGDTDNNAELLDIRVEYTGLIQPTAGEATRAQSEIAQNSALDILEKVVELYKQTKLPLEIDLLNYTNFYNGQFASNPPQQIIHYSYILTSDYVKIDTGDVLRVTPASGYRIYIRYFDNMKVLTGNSGYITSETTITVPTASYLNFTVTKNPYDPSTDVIAPSDGKLSRVMLILNDDTIPSFTAYHLEAVTSNNNYLIGSSGTTLAPAGKYTFSGVFKTTGTFMTMNMYGPNPGSLFTKQINTSNDKQYFEVVTTDPIERIFFADSGQTLTIEDFTVSKFNWMNYEYSNPDNWIPVPYTVEDSETDYLSVQEQINDVKSKWTGKKAIFNGDSITQGIYTAEDGGKTGYVKQVTTTLKFGTMYNYAIGGTRLARVSGEQYALVDRLSAMDTDADLVFIMANTNDYASQVPIGPANSTDPTTYNGALNVILSYLQSTYPSAVIIISTMLPRKVNYLNGVELPIKIEEYAQAVRDRVHDYKMVLYDAYLDSGLNLRTTPTDGTGLSDDNLHPNATGAKMLGDKITAFIEAQ